MSTQSPQSTMREKLRQKRTELILETAEEILSKKGYHATSMDEIAAQAGVAKGTLYQHFQTKEDLFFALIEQALAQFEHMVQEVANSSSNARQKLEYIIDYIYGERQGAHVQLLQILRKNEELKFRLQLKRAQSGARINEAIDQIRTMLEEGKAQGLFHATIATELMLHLFLHTLALPEQEMLFGPQKATAAEIIAQIKHLFFQGILSS